MSWANARNLNVPKNQNLTKNKKISPLPEEGNIREKNGKTEIYTKQKLILANGRTVYGHWVTAADPQGYYGGPFVNSQNLLKDPRFKSNMENIAKDREAYRKWKNNTRRQGLESRKNRKNRKSRKNRS
jgi:hypothetical protein